MKILKNIFLTSILFTSFSCEKNLNEPIYTAYTPANIDANAGAWKPMVLSNVEEIILAAPKSNTSAEYLAEVNQVKSSLQTLTSNQKMAIDYWGAGAVFRWNEIAREMAAKYNLAPVYDPIAGKYPVPDPANPLKEPKFPFANPPYTARAMAYLSVAQYDALVSTWKYKYKYNRKAPNSIDPSIVPILPSSTLPSFPSEDAVVAAASYTILASMFPGELPYLQGKLDDSKNVKMWAGLQVPSDVTAGEELGKAVGAKVLAKSKTDGMGGANNQSLTAGFIEAAKTRGIKDTWLSQESPIRPPMLPNYGAVQTWNFDKATLAKIRPILPYVSGSDEWKKELAELETINKKQTREQARIANYWADGAGSYTPPGHWHRLAANLCHESKFSEVKTARTLALLGTGLMDAGIACWETKYYYYTPRPQQFGIKTSVGLPNFPSYTSGHSTFSASAATILGSIFPAKATDFEAMAKEASNSRVYGLIHFRIDCEMGLKHGKTIGEYAIARAKADGSGL